jgi:hypothetical protein
MQRKIAKKNEVRRRMLQKETWGSYEKYKSAKRKRKNIYRSNLRKLSS